MSQKSKFSPYHINFIEGKKQWFGVFACLLIVFVIMLCVKFYQYKHLPMDKPGEITAQILLQYTKTKDNKTYFVLKLKSSQGHIFYTTSKEDLKPIQNRHIRIYGKAQCSFFEFLRSCFFINFTFSVLPQERSNLWYVDFINNQHQNPQNASLFRTLFFGETLDKQWRDVSNLLGLAHILAISGFHLGVLSSFLFVLITPIYRFFQRRYFSYRNEVYDVGFMIICVMFLYLVFLDFLPSFLRAFIMATFGFLLYFSGLNIINFGLLLLVGLTCIAFFPNVLLSIGFVLSMFGVFYIFLFITHYKRDKKSTLGSLAMYWMFFNVVVFLSITPIVHYFFPYFSPYQLISILVSLAFVVFFPLIIVLHIIGFGGLFDRFLDMVLGLEIPNIDFYLPWYLAIGYVALGLGAIFSKKIYIMMLLCAVGLYVFMCLRFCKVF